jgi:prevent-host-death family protein
MAERIKHNIIQVTELHRQLGKVIRKVALSDEHFVVEKGGLPVAVMMSMNEYERLIKERKLQEFERLTRMFGEEAERQGLTEEKLVEELEEDKREVYKEMYGKDSA